MAAWLCGYVAVCPGGYSELCASRLVGGLLEILDIFEILEFPDFQILKYLLNTLGSFFDHFEIIVGSFWDHFGIMLGSFCDNFGGRFGIILGSFWVVL